MPVGDSITQTATGPLWDMASYLCYLDHMLREAGVSFDFVGSLWMPYEGAWECPWEFDHDHEGYWGKTIDDVTPFVPTHVGDLHPDVVLLLLGANNLDVPTALRDTPEEAADKLAALVRLMQEAQPDVTIFVAQQMVNPIAGAEFEAYNDLIASFGELSTATSMVYVVDIASDYPDGHLDASGHPDDLGAELIAQHWMTALQQAGLVPDA